MHADFTTAKYKRKPVILLASHTNDAGLLEIIVEARLMELGCHP